MSTNPYYGQEGHGPYEMIGIGNLELEEGGHIPDCQLAVATHGTLNAAKDNAILVPTWYSGTSKIMEQVYIGNGRALDPAKYFIIVVNQIGNGLSTSPHNSGGAQAEPTFPKVRIGDDVRAQHKLLTEKYGLKSLALVVGGSMGAQQTYEWAVRYPDFVKRAAPIAGTARNTEHDFVFTETLCEAITSDPGFNGGKYGSPADVVDTFMTGYFAPMDPNDLLAMAWKWQRGDVSRNTGGDLASALGRIKAKTYVMPISHDMFFPPEDCEVEQRLIPGSQFRPLKSICGHLGLFGVDPELLAQLDANLNDLLAAPVN
jgi:homoserine O-acetyltransferase